MLRQVMVFVFTNVFTYTIFNMVRVNPKINPLTLTLIKTHAPTPRLKLYNNPYFCIK